MISRPSVLCLLRDRQHGPDQAEADARRLEGRRDRHPNRGANLTTIVQVGGATGHTVGAGDRPCGVFEWPRRVALAVAVEDPLPDVPEGVVEAPRVGGESADRMRVVLCVARVPRYRVSGVHAAVVVNNPGVVAVGGAVGSGSCHVLPLRLGGQSVAGASNAVSPARDLAGRGVSEIVFRFVVAVHVAPWQRFGQRQRVGKGDHLVPTDVVDRVVVTRLVRTASNDRGPLSARHLGLLREEGPGETYLVLVLVEPPVWLFLR